jgi:hypothetical protein
VHILRAFRAIGAVSETTIGPEWQVAAPDQDCSRIGNNIWKSDKAESEWRALRPELCRAGNGFSGLAAKSQER